MNDLTETTGNSQPQPVSGQLLKQVLNKNQRMFCKKYIEYGNNGTAAYMEVYGDIFKAKNNKLLDKCSASTLSSRLLQTVEILNYVDKVQYEAAMAADVSVEAVLTRFKVWAEFDPRDVFSWKKHEVIRANGSSFKPKRYRMSLFAKNMDDIPEEAWSCIESVEEGRDGFKIRVINKLKANIELAKYLGMDKKVVENTGNVIMSFDKQDENL